MIKRTQEKIKKITERVLELGIIATLVEELLIPLLAISEPILPAIAWVLSRFLVRLGVALVLSALAIQVAGAGILVGVIVYFVVYDVLHWLHKYASEK